MEMPSAFVIAVNGVTHEFDSARPNAPVVPHVEPTRRVRSIRLALSKSLYRAARTIAPAEQSPAC